MATLFAGLYFALTIALGPISYGVFQVRISDALIVMSVIAGLPAVYGVFFGCILANLFPAGYSPNPLDIVAGSLANLLASYIAYKIAYQWTGGPRLILAAFLSTIVVSAIVGSYLPLILMPDIPWPEAFLTQFPLILLGEVVSQMILGTQLVIVIRKAAHRWLENK